MNERQKILNFNAIKRRITRMAYEVSEQHYGGNPVVIAGVAPRGILVSKMLCEALAQVGAVSFRYIEMYPGRTSHEDHVAAFTQTPDVSGTTVIVVDDVLYSGRTLLHAVNELLPLQPAVIQTLVLVDRGHHKVPVQADYCGYHLATTLMNHVSVELNAACTDGAAFLS